MLAGVSAETVANQISDLAIDVVTFQLVGLCPFHNGPHPSLIQRDVPHPVFSVIVMSPLRNGVADLHGLQIIQLKAAAVLFGNNLRILLLRCLEPGDDLFIRECAAVKGDEVRSGKMEFTVDLRIGDADDPLVVGQLDLEGIADIHHMTAETFQLSIHKDQIAAVEIKLIVVVGERHVASREVDQHQGFGRLRLSGNNKPRGSLVPAFLFSGGKNDLELHKTPPSK